MSNTVRVLLASTVLAGMASASVAEADNRYKLSLNSLMFETYELGTVDRDYWRNQSQRANALVKAGEDLSVSLMQYGHNKLELGEGTQTARVWYLLTAGLAANQFQSANATYFGHEFAHFQFYDFYGLDNHYFYDFDEMEDRDGLEVYLHTFLTGGPNATATNSLLESSGYNDRFTNESLQHEAAGINWQTNYSERWVRENVYTGGKSTFSVPGYIWNRAEALTYALGDKGREDDDLAVEGDVTKIADHYSRLGHDVDVNDIALYGLVSVMASPTTWQAFKSLSYYVGSGQTSLDDPFFKYKNLEYTWDLPMYLNDTSVSMSPHAYFRNGNLVWGVGFEAPIKGDDDAEINLSASYSWDKFSVDGFVTTNGDGNYYEVGVEYAVTDHFAIRADHVGASGDTLRGFRNNPYEEDITFVGIRVSF